MSRKPEPPTMAIVQPCARCGHTRWEHCTERTLGVEKYDRSVCLLCNGWYENETYPRDVRRPALHVFKEVQHD